MLAPLTIMANILNATNIPSFSLTLSSGNTVTCLTWLPHS